MINVKNQKIISSERVRDVRKQAKLSQANFAEKLGVSSNTISRIELGNTPLTSNIALQICRNFYVSMDYLFGLSNCTVGDVPCEESCIALTEAQNTVELLQNRILELEGQLATIQAVLGKPIKLKKQGSSN